MLFFGVWVCFLPLKLTFPVKGSDGKYFRLCGPRGLSLIGQNQPQTMYTQMGVVCANKALFTKPGGGPDLAMGPQFANSLKDGQLCFYLVGQLVTCGFVRAALALGIVYP